MSIPRQFDGDALPRILRRVELLAEGWRRGEPELRDESEGAERDELIRQALGPSWTTAAATMGMRPPTSIWRGTPKHNKIVQGVFEEPGPSWLGGSTPLFSSVATAGHEDASGA